MGAAYRDRRPRTELERHRCDLDRAAVELDHELADAAMGDLVDGAPGTPIRAVDVLASCAIGPERRPLRRDCRVMSWRRCSGLSARAMSGACGVARDGGGCARRGRGPAAADQDFRSRSRAERLKSCLRRVRTLCRVTVLPRPGGMRRPAGRGEDDLPDRQGLGRGLFWSGWGREAFCHGDPGAVSSVTAQGSPPDQGDEHCSGSRLDGGCRVPAPALRVALRR